MNKGSRWSVALWTVVGLPLQEEGKNNKDPNNSSTGIVSTSSYPGVIELPSKATLLRGQIDVPFASHHEARIPDGLLPASH